MHKIWVHVECARNARYIDARYNGARLYRYRIRIGIGLQQIIGESVSVENDVLGLTLAFGSYQHRFRLHMHDR